MEPDTWLVTAEPFEAVPDPKRVIGVVACSRGERGGFYYQAVYGPQFDSSRYTSRVFGSWRARDDDRRHKTVAAAVKWIAEQRTADAATETPAREPGQ